jgi:hypothetical protein
MPSIIGQTVGDTTVDRNYQRTFAPFTRFGTRQIAFFLFDLYDLSGDTLIDEELSSGGDNNPYFYPDVESEYLHGGFFAQALRGIQTQAEIFMVFRPGESNSGYTSNTGNAFIVGVAVDTAVHSDSEGFGMNSKSLADAVYDAIDGESGVDCYHMRVRGDKFKYTDLNGLVAPDTGAQVKKVRVAKPAKP